jgi:hypothetical protein
LKRLALSLLACPLILAGALQAGCGGDEPDRVDPNRVLNTAFDGESADTGAEVEVVSLGYEDRPLRTRRLTVNPATYQAIRRAIASPQRGLEAAVADITYEGTEQRDGVEVDHVSGQLDVDELIDSLTGAAGTVDGPARSGLPAAAELEGLRDTLVDGRFDLFAGTGGGPFEQLDLTLSLDDRDNALPPTRIRFSLTESDPSEGSS